MELKGTFVSFLFLFVVFSIRYIVRGLGEGFVSTSKEKQGLGNKGVYRYNCTNQIRVTEQTRKRFITSRSPEPLFKIFTL